MKSDAGLEILSVDLLEEKSQIVELFRDQAKFGIRLGRHYDLDLAWPGSQLEDPSAKVCEAIMRKRYSMRRMQV